MRWGEYIARTAVRRVVWILVGLAVFAALSVVGVRAATPAMSEVLPAGNVSLSSGSYSTVVSVTPDAGTWLLTGQLLLQNGSIAQTTTGRFYDGAAAVASTSQTLSGNGFAFGLVIHAVVVANGTTTYSLQARPSGPGVTVLKLNAYESNGPGATKLVVQAEPASLDQSDKDRLDLLIYTLAVVGGILIVVNTVTAFAVVVGSK